MFRNGRKHILREVENVLSRWGRYSPEKVARRIKMMKVTFRDALVDDYETLIPEMENHPKDRHVLAAAVKCHVRFIVTDNLRDFPDRCIRAHNIEPVPADDFLIRQFHFDADRVRTVLEEQAAEIGRQPHELLKLLARNAPRFAPLLA